MLSSVNKFPAASKLMKAEGGGKMANVATGLPVESNSKTPKVFPVEADFSVT